MPTICVRNGEYFIFDDNAYELPTTHDLKKIFDKVFSVDELMALPVVELNKRGYITDGSCSGHHFPSVGLCDEQEDTLFSLMDEDIGCQLHYYQIEPDKSEAYVGFNCDYPFRTLPKGWYRKANTLRFGYPKGLSDYELYQKQIEAVQSLYTWACSLDYIFKPEIFEPENR